MKINIGPLRITTVRVNCDAMKQERRSNCKLQPSGVHLAYVFSTHGVKVSAGSIRFYSLHRLYWVKGTQMSI